MKKIVLSAIFMFSAAAFAECPVKDFDATKIQKAIDSAGSCYEAANISKECAFGSSIDSMFVSSAIATCKKDFDHISEVEMGVYNGLVSQCGKKYENQSGTMYRSFAAHCALSVTEAYSSVFSSVD